MYAHMAQMNVYVPDELAIEVRAAGLNVSRLTRVALDQELAQRRAQGWLRRVAQHRATELSHDTALGALRAADTDR
jgi:post-segregation antitoxin (ccd killing protein)